MRVFPLLVIMAFFSIALRGANVWLESKELNNQRAFAAEQAEVEDVTEEPLQVAQADTEAIEEGVGSTTEEDTDSTDPDALDVEPDILDGLTIFEEDGNFDMDFARSEMEVLQSLAQRRRELDQREKLLDQKAAMLAVTETQIENKIGELTAIRDELKALLKQQSDEERKRIESLVKIYEGMKPKDAARILNTLETGILIEVMEQMSERKSSPILAEMDADRAREVTTLLAERKKLPDLDL